MSVGNRIFLKRELGDFEVITSLGEIPTSNVADVCGRSCAMNPRIRLMSRPKRPISVGSAFTVKARGGDNLFIHKAMTLVGEGDFLVISNEGEDTRSLVGEVMLAYLHHYKRIAGIIIDGPIRDIDEVKAWDFPIYATGTTPGGPYKDGPGEINVPVSCGEIVVNPGDIILADGDGVIAIPKGDSRAVLKAAIEFKAVDEKKVAAAKYGTLDFTWADELLKSKGCEIIDDIWRG